MTGFLDGQVHESGGYIIDRSLRFSAASSTYLTRTPAGAGDRQKFTFSYWAKRGALGTNQEMYFVNSGGGNFAQISWTAGNALTITSVDASIATCELTTTRVFRDPSAWMHIVIAVDTTQATASNRVKIYINGVQETSFATATYPTLNYNFQLNNTTAQNIGRASTATADGYFAEYHFINTQQLTPSSFGETNIETGEWVAKPYTGTYGTNGFYLPFTDGTSTTTLGNDESGNNNDWTLTNFTRSAGVNDCWMYDVPAGNSSVAGVQPSSNYAVLNALSKMGTPTNSAANLQTALSASSLINGSLALSSGKWYYEARFTSGSDAFIGWNRVDLQTGTGNSFQQAGSLLYFSTNGNRYKDGDGGAAYGASYTTSDVIGCAIDLDTSQVTWYKNNVSQGTISINTGNYAPCLVTGGIACNFTANFGQRSFAYTPPTGFKALCTSNLPTPAIKRGDNHFTAKTRTGTGASFSVSAIRHAVGWLFGKSRSAATDWYDYDVNRGVQKQLEFNTTSAETTETTGLTAFNSDGYTGGALAQMNTNAATYIDCMMKAGGAPVSNTSGSITSQVSANVTAGFSVVTYTGTGANATVGHGLGKVPKFIIIKSISAAGTNWSVHHNSVAVTNALLLNGTNAQTASNWLNGTAPTSTVFSLASSGDGFNQNNTAVTYVAYCFAEIEGFSKAFSFTGNANADGQFVYLGFKPRWILLKCSSTTGNWYIFDTVRNTFNVLGEQLYPNLANAGSTVTTLDAVSNGFKLRLTGDPNAAQTYVGFAIAETPINYANAF